MSRPSPEPWRDPVCGPCACSQLRRTSRAISALYDAFLAPAGLTVTQYAILVTIARASSIHRTQLAAQLGMDRTTLTRNLQPLERDGLVAQKIGKDRREQISSLTAAGRRSLENGFECWSRAQDEFLAKLGRERAETLRTLLAEAADAVNV